MSYEKERKAVAKSRLVPPFGIVLKWFADVLQLRDVATYGLSVEGPGSRNGLEGAMTELSGRTADNVFSGSIVKEITKERMCRALAICLREIPQFLLNGISVEKLTDQIRCYWTEYERTSGFLSSISEHREQTRIPLIRHAAVQLGVRAGALAYLYDDENAPEDQPVWSQDRKMKTRLRTLIKVVGTRDSSTADLAQSKSEIGRWLDDLDVPPASAIERWEALLANNVTADRGVRPLWRLYVGRRIWNSVRGTVPDELQTDVLSAYIRIKQRVHEYLRLNEKVSANEKREAAISLALTGRIADPLLAAQVANGESDIIWRRHIEAVFQIESVATIDIVGLCQTWTAVFSIFSDPRCVGKPERFDEFIRAYYLKAERGGTQPAEYAKLLDQLQRNESKGDIDEAAACAVRLVALAPFAAGSWHALGRMRRFQKNHEATELCFRTALRLDPAALETRTDLVVHLALSGSIEQAREVLDDCSNAQKKLVDWRFAHGVVQLSSHEPEKALQELLQCAQEGFVPDVCYQFAACAAEALDRPKEAREYRKRAAESGSVVAKQQ